MEKALARTEREVSIYTNSDYVLQFFVRRGLNFYL
jgi:hypothetical protein